MSTVGKKNNGDNLLRFSIVVDGIKKSRTHMGSTGSLLLFRKGTISGWSVTADFMMVGCNSHK